jgi:hypothetical protein
LGFTNEEANKKYTEPFDLVINGEKISWVPGALTLVVDPLNEKALEIEASLERFANEFCNYEYEIAATPVGPYLVNDITNPYTFVWAAFSKFPFSPIIVNGRAPTMADMGLGGTFGKRGNKRIY